MKHPSTRVHDIFIWLLKFAAGSVMALVSVSVFAMVYKHTSPHTQAKGNATDFAWQSCSLTSTMMENYSWDRMDENGYHNSCVVDCPEILTMGSSHVEAIQIPAEDNFTSVLQTLTGYSSYSIGVSSNNFYRCVANLDNALNEFEPTRYVIMETYEEELDIETMQDVCKGEMEPSGTPDTGIKKYIQFVPALKPILNQLAQWKECSFPSEDEDEIGPQTFNDEYDKVLNEFLKKISDACQRHHVTPIVFYQPSETLNKDQTVSYSRSEEFLALFKTKCDALGIVFVDMTDTFSRLYQSNQCFAHGFINTGVGSGHLNKNGHRIIAEKLCEVIRETEEKSWS